MVPDLSPSQWEALGTWAAVFLTFGAVIFAGIQVKQARLVRIEQAIPTVVAYMEVDLGRQNVEIVIRNFGPTIARDVLVTSSPPLRRTPGSGGPQANAEPVTIPAIPTIAPGQEWRTWWDSPIARAGHQALKDESRYEVTVTYMAPKTLRKGRESTRSVLDWEVYRDALHLDTKTTHDVAEYLKKISDHVVLWTDGSKGLAVYTRDGETRDRARAEQLRARRAQHAELVRRVESVDGDGSDDD